MNINPPFEVVLYCGCGKEYGPGKKTALGLHFTCDLSADGKTHLGRVIQDSRSARWWLKLETLLLCWQTKISPFPWLRRFRLLSSMQAGHFLAVATAWLVVGLWSLEWSYSGHLADYIIVVVQPILGIGILWRFIDIFLSNLSITFTTRFPANPIRSAVYSLIAFLHITLSFGYLYRLMHIEFKSVEVVPVPKVIQAVYFSLGTITTVGYGNWEAQTCLAQLAVASELALGLFFVVIILAEVAGWAGSSRTEEGTLPIQELKD
ncbi:MAG: hypothetical protein A3G41_04325 [Elusimicrobia bacterium RIFCSPLOWO2_12_FULL_59_9]|nr:MAG: hypothetical protein A3G41_04325 [Elusimicrobia bacterium RIFCSPLOWO2_12_FULL_59_9]